MKSIVCEFSLLPERIRETIALSGYEVASFKLALKTTFKPNATIPIIWIVVLHDVVLMCNTHKSRGIWREFKGGGGNDWIRLCHTSLGDPYLEISDDGTSATKSYITLAREINVEQLEHMMSEIHDVLNRLKD